MRTKDTAATPAATRLKRHTKNHLDALLAVRLLALKSMRLVDDEQDTSETNFEGAEDGDPYKFQFPSTQLEMILDPSLNRSLPKADSALPPFAWSKCSVWYHESETKTGESVQQVICVDSDDERYVVIRRTGSELEASQFTSLLTECAIHPNALPKRIH